MKPHDHSLPAGYLYAGVEAGIKGPKKDVALIFSDSPAMAAGVFTTNRVQAAPVRLCRDRVARGTTIRAIVVNSGNANACTGAQGMQDAKAMTEFAAATLKVKPEEILVCSTGTIGIPMPMDKIRRGIEAAAEAIAPDGTQNLAEAIMTTDTRPKTASRGITVDNKKISLLGFAKGSGMIDPSMATMLAFLVTDANVDGNALQECLSAAVEASFNTITVDGDQSTNDTVLLLANGNAGNKPLSPQHPGWNAFSQALHELTMELAMMIVGDGEGATKLVTVTVSGASTRADARKAARAVCNSALVKTAWFGCDPNWGRIAAAVGYSGAEMNEDLLDISIDGIAVVSKGVSSDPDPASLKEAISGREFRVDISLNTGESSYTAYSTDLSHEYVNINAEYMT